VSFAVANAQFLHFNTDLTNKDKTTGRIVVSDRGQSGVEA
jgi:hypothetical protein